MKRFTAALVFTALAVIAALPAFAHEGNEHDASGIAMANQL